MFQPSSYVSQSSKVAPQSRSRHLLPQSSARKALPSEINLNIFTKFHAPRRPGELKEALEEAFVECDRVLATKPRMALTEHVQDGKSEFQVT